MTDAELRKVAEGAKRVSGNISVTTATRTLAEGCVALLDRIDAVRALHFEGERDGISYCVGCRYEWPCPTKRAADGES